ncbi:MAG: TRAP transporter large permease subunit [Maritimibacter sp.]
MIEIALIAIAILVITLTLGVPLPYCFGAALMVMYFIGDVTMKGMMLWGVQQLGNPVLLAIPLFVLAGTIMSESGIAASLLRFVNAFVGHVRGGLGVVAAVSCAVIGAISGSGLTGIAAIGPIPAFGHDDRLWLGDRHLDPCLLSCNARAGSSDHAQLLDHEPVDEPQVQPGP